jgi:addiction module HigA family antidote
VATTKSKVKPFPKASYTKRYGSNVRPVHPGEILKEEYLGELGITTDELAQAIGISVFAVKSILLKKRKVTTEIAFRLARYFGTTIDLWINLQEAYDVRRFELNADSMQDILNITPRK